MTQLVEYSGERAYYLERGVGRPLLPARITDPRSGRFTDRLLLVDSGADVCAVPVLVLRSIGIELEGLPRVRSGGTAGAIDALEVDLRFEVCDVAVTARTLVPLADGFRTCILGRDPFFRLLHFGFQQFEDETQNRVLWRPGG